ncbi:CD83 antigen-like isoform X2 [Carcharodon carcharias]|nr:CD83 antigen-like isoform X2 [Carcharodon carcharias]
MFLGAESIPEITVKCGETARLPCRAQYKFGIQYRAISWYKIADDGVGLTGIVRKDFQENIARRYLGFNRSIELAPARPFSLIIHNVSSEDFGTYQCSLWAPIGEQNKQADVGLRELGIIQKPLLSGAWLTILPIVLLILGLSISIYMVNSSIMSVRNRKVPSDYEELNNVQATQCSVENC